MGKCGRCVTWGNVGGVSSGHLPLAAMMCDLLIGVWDGIYHLLYNRCLGWYIPPPI